MTAPDLGLRVLDDGDHARWNTFVDASPWGHVFQRWEWGDLQAGLGAQPFRLAATDAGGRIAAALQLLVFDTGSRVFSVVPRGPVVDPAADHLVEPLIDAAVSLSVSAGADLVRIEPQWPAGAAASAAFEARRFAEASQHIMPPRTILVDLTPPPEAIWAAFRSTTRNRIRAAEKRGVHVVADAGDRMEDFIRLNADTQRRHGLRESPPDQYRLAARHFGGGDSMRVFLADLDGDVVAAIVVFLGGATATYLWGASAATDAARQANPNQLLHWAAMQWARERGCATYDFFGVPDVDEATLEAEYGKRSDGWWNLYRFKRGFGGRVHRHAGTFDWVKPAAPVFVRAPEPATTATEVSVSASALPPGLIADLELVAPAAAAAAVDELMAVRDVWTPRHPDYPAFTLGAAVYLDVPRSGFAAYQADARRLNPLLSARFGGLHEQLRQAVAALVHADAGFDDRLALPGFHIYLADPSKRPAAASTHYDLQYELVDWTGIGTPERARQLSLTVSLELPASGGGLLVWNINRLEIERLPEAERRAQAAANRDAAYHRYTVGHLAVHSGHYLHQIAPTRDILETDRRITMQAHAIPIDGRWVIYW